jgi:predicted dehydrogenase
MKKYRIGIVGTGGIARRHTEGYRAVAGDLCEVVAACDINQKTLDSFCEAYKVPLRFTNTDDLIKSGEVDVISLLTPPTVRDEVIFPAFEHGIHILVEKPFANRLSDAVSFVRAAEEAGVVLGVNQQLRHMQDALAAKEIIESGEIGGVRFIAHDQFQNRTRVRGWRKDEKRLEISIFSIHVLDRIRWLAGRPPEKVSAVTRHWNDDVRGETFTALTIQFSDGIVGTMVSNWHSLTIPECRLRVDGTAGSLLSVKKAIVSDKCILTVHPAAGEARQQNFVRQNAFTMAMGENMKCLLESISTGSEFINSGRDNLQTMAIVDAAYLSASQNGEMVDVSSTWRV